jgi:hypothetical protein
MGSGSDRRHLPRADQDMLFAAILVSIGGGFRTCIRIQHQSRVMARSFRTNGIRLSGQSGLIAAHLSANFCGASCTGFGHAANRHGALTHMA